MTFWSGNTLLGRMPALVSDFSVDRIDCAAYTLRMGRQYYLSASEAEIGTNKIRVLAEGDSVAIPSGQFAVLLTEERITVPSHAVAFISMKSGLKARGLVNVSGFHVDPGYSAPLRFAVFNAGPSTICVKQGEDCFLIWYANLDQEDTEHTKKENQNRAYAQGITSAEVSSLTGAVKTVSVLAEKVNQLEKTQIWMKDLIGLLAVVGVLVLGFTVFFAQEGIKSYFSKTSTAVQQTSVPKAGTAVQPTSVPK
jgi:dCTP deaminase